MSNGQTIRCLRCGAKHTIFPQGLLTSAGPEGACRHCVRLAWQAVGRTAERLRTGDKMPSIDQPKP